MKRPRSSPRPVPCSPPSSITASAWPRNGWARTIPRWSRPSVATATRPSRLAARLVGEFVPGGQGVRVLRAEDAGAFGHERGELIPRGSRMPRLPDPGSQPDPVGQSVSLLGGGNHRAYRQWRRQLSLCWGGIPFGRRLADTVGSPAVHLVLGDDGHR